MSSPEAPPRKPARSPADTPADTAAGTPLDALPDDELERLNALLPWAGFLHDSRGRSLGRPFSETKRNTPQGRRDRRLTAFDDRFGLAGRSVLELGCFEGFHTLHLAQMAGRVVAIDGRIENVVKTLARCALLGQFPRVYAWNLEEPCPGFLDPVLEGTDFLVHIGVLYHLCDPVGHLMEIAPRIGRAILLDSHVAGPDDATDSYTAAGETWRFRAYREGPRDSPFAGLVPTARWLTEPDLLRALKTAGFPEIEIRRRREERNGPRITLFASR